MAKLSCEKTNHKPKRGFTIIEVVLVLAIGGLIFLMVFIALPALQRSQRNTQRRNDINRFAQAAIEYQKRNSGKLPFRGTDYDENFVPRYIDSNCKYGSTHSYNFGSDFASNVGSYVRNIRYKNCSEAFTDPDGTIYQIYHLMNTPNSKDEQYVFSDEVISSNSFMHAVLLISRSGCGSIENTIIKKDGKNDFAIIMKLEGGSVYCVDNS